MSESVTTDRRGRVTEIFAALIDLPESQRPAKLDELSRGDAATRAEVESWLESYAESSDFLEEPAFSIADLGSAHGKTFGPYAIIGDIGRGGMGAVYLAERKDGEFDQRVAIKIVRQSIAEDFVIERFRRERQILASLSHSNIAKLLDGGVSSAGEPYLVMEFIEGRPITEFAETLTIVQKLRLFLKVCAALSYAHRNLVVHRDIKPGNILVTTDGEPKLLDFGLAKLVDESLGLDVTETRTEFRALTPAYASPEQLRGEAITTSSDVYSLGVVLYELLTGQRPFTFEGMSLDQMIRAVSTTGPVLPSRTLAANHKLRGDIDNIILKALRNEPDRRYQSVEQFAEDIQRHLDGLPVTARKDTLYYRTGKFVMRYRGAVAASLLIFVVLVTGIVLTVRERRKADRRFNDVRQLANALMFEVDSEIQKGPTKGRAMIAKRALEYLDSLALESGNEDDLQVELAAGYLKVGDIQGKPYRPNLGDTAGSAVSYRKAIAILDPLTEADPANLEARRYLSLSWQSLGRVEERNSEWETALESERRAVELSENLLAADPLNANVRNLLADNYLHFGEALYQLGRGATVDDHHKAIEYFRRALDIHSGLAGEFPENASYRYSTGVDYEYVGIAFNRLGDMTGETENYRSALENHLKELEINEALAASDQSNAAYRRIVADVQGEVALSQVRLGRTAEALDNYRQMLATFESVKASDPTNVEAVRDVVNALVALGHALEQSGDTPKALVEMRRASMLTGSLLKDEPENATTLDQQHIIADAIAGMEKKFRH